MGTIQEWLNVAFGQNRPSHMVSTVEPYRKLVKEWREQHLSVKAIWQRLEKRGYPGSYGSVLRFVQRLETDKKHPPICTTGFWEQKDENLR